MHHRKLSIAAVLAMVPGVVFALGIESVTMHIDDNGEKGEEVEAFVTTDLKQHFAITLDETKVGNNNFAIEFWAVDTSAGQNIKVTEWTGSSLMANTLNSSVSLPREWPVGQYRLDVKHSGKTIGSFEYEIVEAE